MKDAADVDALAWAALADPYDLSLPLSTDLRAALDSGRRRGVLYVPPVVSQQTIAATLQRTKLGERIIENRYAWAYLLHLSEAHAFNAPAYAQVIVLDNKPEIIYTNVQALADMRDSVPLLRTLTQWDIGSVISMMLRWYGFSGNYGAGHETKFTVNSARWTSWTDQERSQAIARARRLATDYRGITFSITKPTRFRIVADDQRVVYDGVA